MPANDPLIQLIKSLNKTEKRHFGLYARTYFSIEDKAYFKLFRLLDSLQQFDDKAVQQKLKGSALLKNLPSTKKYLYELIIESLIKLNQDDNAYAHLKKQLNEIEILISKNILPLAFKRLEKVKKKCYELEFFDLLIQALNFEPVLLLNAKYDSERMEACYAEKNILYQKLINLDAFNLLAVQFHNTYNSVNKAETKQYQTILQNPLLGSEKECLSISALKIYYHIKSYEAFMLSDHERGIDFNQKTIDLYEEHVAILENDVSSYLNAVTNQAYHFIGLQDWQNAQQYITKIEKLPLTYKAAAREHTRAETEAKLMNLYVRFYSDQRMHDKVIALEAGALKLVRSERSPLHDSKKAFLLYEIALAHFTKKQYDAALKLLNEIFNTGMHTADRFITMRSYILRSMLHYELQHTEILPGLLQAIQHQNNLHTKSAVLKHVAHILKMLMNSYRLDKQTAVKLHKELEKIPVRSWEVFREWVEGKIKGTK